MKEQIAWVRDALAKKETAKGITCFYVAEGKIWATDGRLVASHPFPYIGDPFLVPGEDFGKVVTAAPSDPTLGLEGGVLHIKAGKFKGKIKTVDPSVWPVAEATKEITGAWQPVTEELVNAFQRLIPFTSENASSPVGMSVGLLPGWAYATNNVALARAVIKDNKASTLVPSWVLAFLLSRKEGLSEWYTTDQASYWRWESGATLRAVAVNGQFSDQGRKMIEAQKKTKMSDMAEITAEWREVLARIVGLVGEDGGLLQMMEDKIVGTNDRELEIDEEISTPIPAKHPATYWIPKTLTPVIAAATHWCPDQWPAPSYWLGEGIEGVIVGRNKP